MRWALGIEYDGQPFSGWERQTGEPTVQAAVEAALARVADGPVRTTCAGRTDAGVHALSQVVHFDAPCRRPQRAWVLGVNGHLPSEVSVRWAEPVDLGFHARFSARSRTYRYLILNRPSRPGLSHGKVGWVRQALEIERMQQAAEYLLGEHDFSSLRAAGCQAKSPWRRVYELTVRRSDELITVDVCANAFLQHMVRNLVGALLEVGKGKQEPRWIVDLLALRDRRAAGMTMPPGGLYFVGVDYPPEYRLPRLPSLSVL